MDRCLRFWNRVDCAAIGIGPGGDGSGFYNALEFHCRLFTGAGWRADSRIELDADLRRPAIQDSREKRVGGILYLWRRAGSDPRRLQRCTRRSPAESRAADNLPLPPDFTSRRTAPRQIVSAKRHARIRRRKITDTGREAR